MSKFEEFSNSEVGKKAMHARRKRKCVMIWISDIEPQSKKMRKQDQQRFQNAVAEHLARLNRSTFTGKVALKLSLATTSKNPPHAHTIAKNLLDLLGKKVDGVSWPKRYLLYKDDSQIQALSVSCRHGEAFPMIIIEVMPFPVMLENLELAAKASRDELFSLEESYAEDRETDMIRALRSTSFTETVDRDFWGVRYDAYLKFTRWEAQRALLKRSGMKVPTLHWLYDRPNDGNSRGNAAGKVDRLQEYKDFASRIRAHSADTWASYVSSSPLRLQFGELPINDGESARFKVRVGTEIAEFKNRWAWVIEPLEIPVALEVVVRPSPATPPGVLHDLDNIVRDYLIPGIVPSFGTVSDHRWLVDNEGAGYPGVGGHTSLPNLAMPPSSTKPGVTRYEVWRLSAVQGEPGFLSVALVADVDVSGDLMSQIERTVEATISSSRRHRRW